jgi:sulfotransferase family protein
MRSSFRRVRGRRPPETWARGPPRYRIPGGRHGRVAPDVIEPLDTPVSVSGQMPGSETVTPVLVRLLEGRVGSVLLMQLLGTSSDVALDRTYPYESSYLSYLARLACQLELPPAPTWILDDLVYGDPTITGPLPFESCLVDREVLARRSLRALWTVFSESVRAKAGRDIPLYTEKFWGSLASLTAAGIRPIVIDLIRDPRDIVASVNAVNARSEARGDHLRFGRTEEDDDAAHLRRLVARMAFRCLEFSEPLDVPRITVRYEELVLDLEGSAARIGAFLGVALDADLVSTDPETLAVHATTDSVADSVGAWRQLLRPEQVNVIQRRLGAWMTSNGYAPD